LSRRCEHGARHEETYFEIIDGLNKEKPKPEARSQPGEHARTVLDTQSRAIAAANDPLALLAALFPDRMLALVMGEVERIANDPLPVDQRPPRVAALERELDKLHRAEEALVAAAIATGQPVHRSPSAPPAAVLGVRVTDRISRAA
jgi:hypothetical protein